MTDGRIPGKWIAEPRFAEMPDATFGFLARALAWSNEAGTDGLIKRRYLAQLHSSGEQQPQVYAALEAAGLWKSTPEGYQFINWDKPAHLGGLGQSLAATVQAGKQRNKEKQQRYRDRAKSGTTPDNPSRNPVTLPGDVGQDTTGQDRLITGGVSETSEATNFAPCCGEVHGPMEPCPLELFRGAPKTSAPDANASPDPGYCSKHGGPWPCKKSDDGCRRAA